jgi:hypothetical protein
LTALTAYHSKWKFGRVDAEVLTLEPVGIDVSPPDNSGFLMQEIYFKKHNSYALMLAYANTKGHMLIYELRPGKQHGNSSTYYVAGVSPIITSFKIKGGAGAARDLQYFFKRPIF